jgi:PAS domain S-box-containing protein
MFESDVLSGLHDAAGFLELVHPDDRNRVARQVPASRDLGEPFRTEFRVVEPSGRIHWLAADGKSECDESGRPVRLIGVVQDITERKNAEDALRLSEERFRRIADQSPDIIFRVGRKGLEYVSPACYPILGVRPEENGAGSSLFPDLVCEEDRAKIPVIERRLMGGPVRCEVRLRHADGRTIWTEQSLNPIFTPSGKLFAIEGIIRDVSDRKRAEESLSKQRKEQQIIFDSVPAMIWYKDRENRILRANLAAAQSMGKSVEELEGCSTYDLYPDEAAQYHQDDLEVIRSGAPKLGIVELLQDASGVKRWIQTDKIPYRDEQNEIIGVIVFAVDVTAREQAEQALRQTHDELELRVCERTAELASLVEVLRSEMAERKRAEGRVRHQQDQLAHVQRLGTIEGMASQLAHEINQPLAAIVNFADGMAMRLRHGETDTAAMSAAAAQVREQAVRAGEVIRRLRSFVRKEAARREYADVNDLVQEATHLIESEAQRKGVAIRFHLETGMLPIQVDPVQIEQVVVNLLRNGIDSVSRLEGEAGEIVVTTEIADGSIRVAIRDTGTGLPDGAEEKLFEPYFTTKPDGLGMGLSISRSIIEAHGGSMWAEPNEPRGMIFVFRLPVTRPSQSGGPNGASIPG